MTSRERINIILNGGTPDRPPFNFWMDRDIMSLMDQKYGKDFRITHYDADLLETFAVMDYFPNLQAEYIFDGKTNWMIKPKLTNFSEIFKYDIPNPNNPEIYSNIISTRKTYPSKAIFAMMIAPLGIISQLKMPQDMMMGLILEEEIIIDILEKITPAMLLIAENTCKLDIDVLYLAEDLCMSTGLMYSKDMLKKFNFDYMKEIIEIAHSNNKKVFYHTDGFILDAIDLFIDYGFDGINPLEPRYNNSQQFIEKSKNKLMLYGGIDNCNIIPNGTCEDIKDHIENQFDILGKNGRMIFSSHDIPSHCPIENLDTMVNTIKNLRY